MGNQQFNKYLNRDTNYTRYPQTIVLVVIFLLLTSCKKINGIDYSFLDEERYFSKMSYDSLITYYPNHKIKTIKKSSGKLALEKYFYENGNLKSYIEVFNDSIVGNAYLFYESGELKHYNFINEYNGVCYVLKWDSKGKIITDDGVTVSPDITVLNGDELKYGDSLISWTQVPSPPHTNTIVYAGITDMKGNIIDSQEVTIIDHFAKYTTIVKSKDSIKVFFKGIMYNKEGQKIHENMEEAICRIN